MADVTGPISTLPGAAHAVPKGTMCDDHLDRPAVARIQGETDSMGSELNDMCQECLDEYRESERTRDRSGYCEWCKQQASYVAPMRDFEEGMSGRLYDVCNDCRKRVNDAAAAEMDRYYDEVDDYGDWDDE